MIMIDPISLAYGLCIGALFATAVMFVAFLFDCERIRRIDREELFDSIEWEEVIFIDRYPNCKDKEILF